ncbi:MAG: hypothetical protein GX901_06200 [Lentisphaerae bacterium]|nr:hypothetical protein [Lentisphaerota bacterium]
MFVEGYLGEGLSVPQATYGVPHSIADLTPSLAALWGLRKPAQCQAKVIPALLKAAREKLGAGQKLQKTFFFCPDAIGDVMLRDFPGEFSYLQEHADIRVRSTAVMPSVTPVCFSSIFTGAAPATHGVVTGARPRPILTVETLFDVLIEAGQEIAIVASNNCSIDRIFRDRSMDYYSTRGNAQSFELCQLLLERYDYDVIVCYDGGYDSFSHKFGSRAKESFAALRASLERFKLLDERLAETWKEYNYMLTFTPDHGNHNYREGKATHGYDMYDDMVINHFYKIAGAQKVEA